MHEFYAIVTHPRGYAPPSPLASALDQMDAWMESPSLALLGESEQHGSTLEGLLRSARSVGRQVHDARIAALCLQHGVRELWTAHRDFGRFGALEVRNPLIGASPDPAT